MRDVDLSLGTPKLSTGDLTSSSITENTTSITTDDVHTNTKRLAYRKRNSNLNQSLNETDLNINSANRNRNKNKIKQNNKRKLKQRKIDLNDDHENSRDINSETYDDYNEYDDDDFEYNSDDAVNTLSKNVNYRSLQKSKRSIKTIEQTIKNSKSIEKWLNDFDKIKELDQPTIIESPASTIKPDKAHNEELYKLLLDELSKTKNTLSQKLCLDLPSGLVEHINNMLSLNSIDSTRSIETEMFNYVKKFVLPKSLANLDDINYLKWFLNEKIFP